MSDPVPLFGWIAYAYPARREARSSVCDDRLGAARELLRAYPRLKTVATCRAHRGWPTGQDIHWHTRRELESA